MQYVASAAKRQAPPLTMRERIDKLDEWSRAPMSKLAEIVVPAAAGSVMFVLFIMVYLST